MARASYTILDLADLADILTLTEITALKFAEDCRETDVVRSEPKGTL